MIKAYDEYDDENFIEDMCALTLSVISVWEKRPELTFNDIFQKRLSDLISVLSEYPDNMVENDANDCRHAIAGCFTKLASSIEEIHKESPLPKLLRSRVQMLTA